MSQCRQGFVLALVLIAAFLSATAQTVRAEDRFVDAGSDERRSSARTQGFVGGRRLKQSYASSSGSGSNVQTSTRTTANGETTTSGETKSAPPGGTVSSSVSSYAPTNGAKPTPGATPTPYPPPPPPPCTDIPPPLNKYTCAQQKAFGKCKADWLVSNGWCKHTCGYCVYPPPPPKFPSFPPFQPFPLPFTPFPPISIPQLPPITIPNIPSTPAKTGNPCYDSDYQSGSGSVSASAACNTAG